MTRNALKTDAGKLRRGRRQSMRKVIGPKFYQVTFRVANKLREGEQVYDVDVGFFTTFAKAKAAGTAVLCDPQLLHGDKTKPFAIVIEEILVDVVDGWLRSLPTNYHRIWLLDAKGCEVCHTPGIEEMWSHGTTKTPQVYKCGDIIAYVEHTKDGKRHLKAGVVTSVPRYSEPEHVRRIHKSMFHTSIDVTDEYLWYWVQPSNKPYSDVQLCQTSIYPIKLKITAARRRSLQALRRRVLG